MRRQTLILAGAAASFGAALAAIATVAITSTDGSGVEIGDTFTAQVRSYYPPDSANVLCFTEKFGCGTPIFSVDDDMQLKRGQEVTVTALLLEVDSTEKRLAFFVHHTG